MTDAVGFPLRCAVKLAAAAKNQVGVSLSAESGGVRHMAMALRERMGWQKALVALAHKNARILWALLTSGELYRADHVSTPAHQAHGPNAQPLTH